MGKEIFIETKERVIKTEKENSRFSDLWKKMENSLTIEEKKELENINFNREHNLQASLFDFGFVKGYKLLETHILELIDKDIEYQKSKLTGSFEKDKPIEWRITGFKDLKKRTIEVHKG